MPNEVIVSVIIPTHNRSALLQKAVYSVLHQTISEIEVLVCDDGSTDDTREVVQKIEEQDSRVKYLACGENGRPAIPRNIGIREAQGIWLAFLDDDDYWISSKLEKQLEELQRTKSLASCTNAYRFNENSQQLFWKGRPNHRYSFSELYMENSVICSSVVVHRSVMDKAIGFPEEENLKAIEDYALWLRVSCFTKFCYLNEPLLFYLDVSATSIRNGGSLSVKEQRARCIANWKKWTSMLEEKDKYSLERKLAFVKVMTPIWILRRMVRKRIWK